MILSGETIKDKCKGMITPYASKGTVRGRSYGLSYAGYDIRIKQSLRLPPKGFSLASTIERFNMPNDVLAIVHDKSSWARVGLSVFNTVVEPGWEGWLTLELINHSDKDLYITEGDPIAQMVFHQIDKPVDGYKGKYQNQGDEPVEAKYEF